MNIRKIWTPNKDGALWEVRVDSIEVPWLMVETAGGWLVSDGVELDSAWLKILLGVASVDFVDMETFEAAIDEVAGDGSIAESPDRDSIPTAVVAFTLTVSATVSR